MFTEQQQEIIDRFGVGQAVVAGAGCGKTTTLVAKCLALLQKNPEARFCAVSFTEKSVRDLKASLNEGFSKAGVPFDSRAHWVKTIHGLCATIIQDFPLQSGLQGGERVMQEDQASLLWARSISLLWSQNESMEISGAIEQLLQVYSRSTLEDLLKKLRSLMSFGVEDFIHRTFDRVEVKNLWTVFQSVYARYQHAKQRQGFLDFNDLEIFAVKALESPVVGQYYQNRFNLVLVDEFQDTNPLQGRILERFVKPTYENLCIVGDPKQSIYRFRDADVTVFSDLIAKLPSKHLLDTNYRSRPPIIDFVNEVCAPVFEASQLSYEPLRAGKPDAENAPICVSRLMLDDEETLARFLKAQEVAGTDLSEYVVLMRSLRSAKGQAYLKAFDRFQVPFILGSGGRFYSDPRVEELVALLKGWISKKNTLSQATVLRSPWIKIPDDKLIQWKDAYFEKFFATDHEVAQKLAPLYLGNRPVRPGEILETLMSVESLDEEMTIPLVSLWHKVEGLSSQGRRFEEVVQYLSQAIEEEKVEKEVPPPMKSGTVRVMTIHGSKGLQFPRVILTDFDGPNAKSHRSNDLIWDRKKGVHLFIRDESGTKTEDAENLSWSELEKQALVAEGKRVFYVAITRPQEELILAWKKEVKVKKDTGKAKPEPFALDDWRTWVELTALPPEKNWDQNFVMPLVSHSSVTQERHSLLKLKDSPKLYRPRHSPSEWLVLNQCALRYQYKFLQQLEVEVGTKSAPDYLNESFQNETVSAEQANAIQPLSDSSGQIAFSFDAPEALSNLITASENTASSATAGVVDETVAQKGERIHLMLETENWEGLAAEYDDSSLGEQVAEQVREYFSERESANSADHHIFRELGFEIPLNSLEALAGQMDRLDLFNNGDELRLTDYKWTAKPKTSEALLENYLLQLQLYLWAAQKLLPVAPKKVSAQLMHFTQAGMHLVEAPESAFQKSKLDELAKNLFLRAKAVMELHQAEKSAKPEPGIHCNYCEFRSICPAWK